MMAMSVSRGGYGDIGKMVKREENEGSKQAGEGDSSAYAEGRDSQNLDYIPPDTELTPSKIALDDAESK